MLLADIIAGSTLSQPFGRAVPNALKYEPAMFAVGDRAFWLDFPGAAFFEHFHAGVDRYAALGTPVLAREAGKVEIAGYHNNISGNVVRVEIRPGVSRYSQNHLLKVLVKPGQWVVKGQPLGLLGHSGVTTTGGAVGTTHLSVEIYEKGIGWVCYNPRLFEPGGKLQHDSRTQPVASPVADLCILKGPGINIRLSPDFDVGSGNIFATSRADGIYQRSTGKRIHTNFKTGFLYRRDVSNDDGTWVEVWGFNRVLYIYKSLVTIIQR